MGKYHVYYRKQFHPRINVDEYRASDYVGIGHIDATDKEDVFRHFQGEVWSPNGEARGHIVRCGTDHTSMSCGDMLIDPDGVAWLCMSCGWEVIPDVRKD